jgi:hypothetical protein
MRKRTRNGRLTASVLGAVLLTACGDDTRNPLAPTGLSAGRGYSTYSTWGQDGSTVASASVGGILEPGGTLVGQTVFTVSRDGGSFRLAGGHEISFQREAICDPLTSGYGPGTWDLPCDAARSSVTITATAWTDADGHARVDFAPDLRFASLRDGGSKVLLQLKDPLASDPAAAIFYCPTLGECYDESMVDVGVRSKRDSRRGSVYRYIKHFSGYNVSTGRAMSADVSLDGAESFE